MYTVDNVQRHVNFGAKGIDEVIQNVKTILTTRVGTVPLDREFGLNYDQLSEDYVRDIIHKNEPRVIVKDVEINVSNLSEPAIQVRFDINL